MQQMIVWLPWVPAGFYLVGAICAAAFPSRRWLASGGATRLALAAALLQGAAAFLTASETSYGSVVAHLLAVLIAFLGWVIGDYASRYLRGEAGQTRFVTAYLATLASVSVVAASSHLGVIIIAWAASGVALHQLLTFYRDRTAALIVAHKKFLASRLAELLLIVAAILLYREWGTLELSGIALHTQAGATLPTSAAVAAILISMAVLLKCAQVPLHGWLIQVMEAPTPVSALLHAGVVNLGGYVLIRLAPLISASVAAQTLLVVVGSLTAALAGIVMLTRITIKVRLAWSTCSQMGFMVMECGLGLYDLALLHLLAHSLYKAHAFLTAGEAVRDGFVKQLVWQSQGLPVRGKAFGLLPAIAVAWGLAAGSAWVWHAVLGFAAVPWVATLLLACGLGTLLWAPASGLQVTVLRLLAVFIAAQLYLAWHGVMAGWVGVSTYQPAPLLAIWSGLVFVALFAAQGLVLMRRPSGEHNRLYDWTYAGFYLDERFTRLTFRVWPARVVRGDYAYSSKGTP